MLVPEYWAEARIEGKLQGKPRVMRRFGWSDDSQEAAERHAQERATVAMQALQRGEQVRNRDPKMVYGGAHGLPIREQIVARTEREVITRNTYGARCLNEPDVLFADLDDDRQPMEGCGAMLLLLGVVIVGVLLAIWEVQYAVQVASVAVVGLFAAAAWSSFRRRGTRGRMLVRVRDYAADRSDRRLAVYETPAGLRVLALHATFDPTSEATADLLEQLRSDPVYRKMCRLQACFRARVSGKPWRMDITDHIKPRPGVWPINPARRAERDAWIERYERIAQGYAACRFLEELGTGTVNPRCAEIQRVHDEMCRARTDLPIA